MRILQHFSHFPSLPDFVTKQAKNKTEKERKKQRDRDRDRKKAKGRDSV